MADAEHEARRFEELRTRLEIAVGRVLQDEAVALGPFDEGLFPIAELTQGRALFGNPMALVAGASVIGVEAETAPVVIGVIRVRGELQQRLGALSRLGRPQDEIATPLRRPRVALDESSAAIPRAECHVIVTAAPVRGDFQRHRRWPMASVRGSIRRHRLLPADDRGQGRYGFALRSDPRDLDREIRGARGNMQRQLVARRITDSARVTFDKKRSRLIQSLRRGGHGGGEPQAQTEDGQYSKTREVHAVRILFEGPKRASQMALRGGGVATRCCW